MEAKLETLNFSFPAGSQEVLRKVQVGVVSSGNLEVLLEPAANAYSRVRIRTSASGYGETWKALMQVFFDRHDVAACIEINDCAASPPVVLLRLEQALEESL